MTPTPEDQAKLERLIHHALRDLPERRAPISLEQRVRTEIARRAARPWWRHGFAHWPLAARGTFLVLSAGVVKLVLVLVAWATGGFEALAWRETFAQPIAWLESGLTVAGAIGNSCEILVRSIPPLWLYGGLTFCAAMYAALYGLGAAAYRTYQTQRWLLFP